MAQQLEAQKQLFRFQKIQLFKNKPLGIGSYGSVCKAMCDELPCAAKILHPTILDPHDPGAQRIVQRFEQECDFLSSIRHPHIVQYLGVTKDPELGLQVLLMELMDESLTIFLENAQEPIPYHIQVNLCHDIALALSFLHSIQITHRDLSSNNVLLIGGIRAKVTDFGMSRLGKISPHRGKLTECPGTLAYMPPEAFGSRLKYTQKLDCFSFGVLGVQIMTGKFPDPSDSERIVAVPKYRNRTLKEVVPEIERRKDHVELIDLNHPLLTVALTCLKDREKERPTSQELCRHLSSLKEASQYTESEYESSMARRKRQIKEQCDQQIQELQLQLTAQRSADAKIFHQERKQLQDKLEAQQQQVSYQKYQIQQLQQEREQLQGELQRQKQQVSHQKHQIQQLQQENEQLQGELQRQKQQISHQKHQIQQDKEPVAQVQPELLLSSQVLRHDIVDAIRGVKVQLGPGQQLRRFEVSPDVYQKAKEFVKWAPNFGAESQPYRFKMDFLYQLLQTNINSKTLQEAWGEVEGWQSACKALLRYALNLLLEPKRPEFRRLKLSSSFYVYQVLRKLPKGAEKILDFMGYKATSHEMQELKYDGEVNTERVLETAADLVILHSELDLIKELIGNAIQASPHPARAAIFFTLWNILDVRGRTDERYDDTWQRLMKEAYKESSRPPLSMNWGQIHSQSAPCQQYASSESPAGSIVSQAQCNKLSLSNSQPHHHHHNMSSEQTTNGGCGNEQIPPGGCGSEQTQNAVNISVTLMESDREVSTSQSSTAKHGHEQSQPAKPVWILDKSPQLHASEKTRSFQEKVQDLFQQFPGLVAGQVVQSEVELEQLAVHRQNRSDLMNINNLDIKDARSVRDESGFGPCYDSPPAIPYTKVQREAWKVHTSLKTLDSGSSNDKKKSPIPSLGSASLDDVKLQFPGGHPSPSSSGTEDIYNSSAGPSLESPKHKSAEESGGAAVEQETFTTPQTSSRVVADSGDTLPSLEPRQPLRRPLSHQSAVSDSDNKGQKPIPRPRQKKLQEMHKASKSLDNDLDEPKPPQPTSRGLVRTVKSAISGMVAVEHPSDLVVGQTDKPDFVVHGFWFCSYCTNLVSNTASMCDICGTGKEAV